MARKTPTVREVALKLLSRREHSRGELRRKLSEKFGRDGWEEEIDAELTRLQELNLLSDMRFAQAYARAVVGKFAARRIRAELKKREVGDDEIEAALTEIGFVGGDSEELTRAREMISRRRKTAAAADSDSARRENARLMRWLTGRGFSFEVARRATETGRENE